MQLKRYTSLLGLFLMLSASFFSCNNNSSSEPSLILFDFENDFDKNLVKTNAATFQIINKGDNNLLEVTNGTDHQEPGVVLKEPKNQPWNFTGFHQVQADVQNTGDEPIQVEMFVGNDPNGLVRWYCSDYVDLEPNERKTITVDLAWTNWVHEPQLDIKGMRGAPGKIKTNLENINELTFCSRYAAQENTFTVDNVRAVGRLEVRDTADFFPFIDEYGQYKHENWKDKINSEKDFQAQVIAEQQDVKRNSSAPSRNKFGGWKNGPQLKSTGWFRAEKLNGKWWMIDPEGRLFWSAGMNCVASHTGLSGTQGREHYFENLPNEGSPFAQFYDKGRWASHGFYQDKIPYDAYQFYKSNLYRKYGDEWQTKFREQIHTRFRSWGLNTIGNVSDMEANQMQKTPYTGTVWINGTPKIEGSQGFWGKFHDVFDPKFRAEVRESMSYQKGGANDPWCIGFFVDNEMSWGKIGSLAEGTLRSPAYQPAKIEFIKDLKVKYKNIAALNAQWKTNHTSWNALLESTQTPDRQHAKADLHAFYKKIAETYFKTVKEELNRIAPNQYYLGCRFAWQNNDITITAAAQYCDIVSFNKYEYSVEKVGLPEGVDKPIMIGEFHFGALDRGHFHVGVKKAASQEHRGELYQAYIQGALRNPNIVGAHWFQYTDEAPTGREDGENYNVGFVTITDTPYEELIKKVRETTYSMYEYRMENRVQKAGLLGKR